MNVELSKTEAELQTEESNLHAELSRVALQGGELEVKLKAFATRSKTAKRPGKVPEVDADAAFERATIAREAAMRTRKEVTQQVRTQLGQLRAQLKVLSTQLAEDEKAFDEAEKNALREAPTPPPQPAASAPPMLSRKPSVPIGKLKVGQPAPPPAPAEDPELALSALPDEKTLLMGRSEKAQLQRKISPPDKEKKPVRISPRVAMQASIDFGSDDNFYNGFSSNISDGGVFIATVNVSPLGTEVDLNFSLPTGAKIHAKGVVRWVREVNDKIPDSFPGMGVEFRGLPDTAQQAINDFIAQREPLFYAEAA